MAKIKHNNVTAQKRLHRCRAVSGVAAICKDVEQILLGLRSPPGRRASRDLRPPWRRGPSSRTPTSSNCRGPLYCFFNQIRWAITGRYGSAIAVSDGDNDVLNRCRYGLNALIGSSLKLGRICADFVYFFRTYFFRFLWRLTHFSICNSYFYNYIFFFYSLV